MNACPDREAMLQAYVDNELDAANALAFEGHLKTCDGCAARVRLLHQLKARLAQADLNTPAPHQLRQRIDNLIDAEVKPVRREPRGARRGGLGWLSTGAMTAVAASLAFVQFASPSLADQLVADHVRSLQADHLMDVATSDRHTVKPWFNGKIDFAPVVPDLAAQGFPLAGGRLDYADGRQIAALVYRRRAHVINVFVMPPQDHAALRAPAKPTSYSTVRWRQTGLDYWAVSDIDRGDLVAFKNAFETATR
ncbi:MAG TPA: anti-sigma factor [Caulobacteraceae bacterium]|nr:anti-sigma factor [Caulobacteraceae bacterium]